MRQAEVRSEQDGILDACLCLMRAGIDDDVLPPPPAAIGDSLLQIIDLARDQLVLWPVCQGLLKAARASPHGQAIALVANGVIGDIESQARQTRDQLVELAGALTNAGIDPVFLKGAAFIAEAGMAPQPWRPMCDLDFLVEPDEVEAVVSIAGTLGYQPAHGRYSEKHDVHFPMLLRPPDVVGLEPHIRLTWADLPPFFSPAAFRRNAVRAGSGDIPVRIPSDGDRLTHLIVHAQISGHRYDRCEIVLRDLIDWRRLSRRPAVDLDELGVQFAAAGYGNHFRAFADFCNRFWAGPQARAADSVRRIEDQWRIRTLRGLADQRFHGRALVQNWLRMIARALVSPREARRLVRSLSEERRPAEIRYAVQALLRR